MSAVVSPIITPPAPTPPVPAMTGDEFVRRYAGQRVEVIDDQLRELPMAGAKHGKVCNTAAYLLTDHVLEADAGHVMSCDSFVRITEVPLKVLAPDVCFYSYERLPRGPVPDGLLPVVPDLAVEVRSPSDTWIEVFGKTVDLLKAGVRVVVVLDMPTKTASVCRPDAHQVIVEAEQELVIPDILPGFAVRVGRLFDA